MHIYRDANMCLLPKITMRLKRVASPCGDSTECVGWATWEAVLLIMQCKLDGAPWTCVLPVRACLGAAFRP